MRQCLCFALPVFLVRLALRLVGGRRLVDGAGNVRTLGKPIVDQLLLFQRCVLGRKGYILLQSHLAMHEVQDINNHLAFVDFNVTGSTFEYVLPFWGNARVVVLSTDLRKHKMLEHGMR